MLLSLLFAVLTLIPMIMLIILIKIKIKSGKSLIKIINYEFYIFLILSFAFFTISLYVVIMGRNAESLMVTSLMFSLSIYFGTFSIITRNSITRKGIIILSGIPHLLKWQDIQRFAISGRRIYFKSQKGYSSIIVYNKNIKDFQNLLNIKISYSK